ncbi:hypothetical protein N9N67_10710 [Bacteriovoracaceae bacterium]|nr:hypothetical protein [Bacteriovoracaceae bacterium]
MIARISTLFLFMCFSSYLGAASMEDYFSDEYLSKQKLRAQRSLARKRLDEIVKINRNDLIQLRKKYPFRYVRFPNEGMLLHKFVNKVLKE